MKTKQTVFLRQQTLSTKFIFGVKPSLRLGHKQENTPIYSINLSITFPLILRRIFNQINDNSSSSVKPTVVTFQKSNSSLVNDVPNRRPHPFKRVLTCRITVFLYRTQMKYLVTVSASGHRCWIRLPRKRTVWRLLKSKAIKPVPTFVFCCIRGAFKNAVDAVTVMFCYVNIVKHVKRWLRKV